MRVVLINGSPREKGNTAKALEIVSAELESGGIGTELIHIGKHQVLGCIACGACIRNAARRCTQSDILNNVIDQILEADGLIIGSPVYFAGLNGSLKSFLDRVFYIGRFSGAMRHKVGAAIGVARREGGTLVVDQINKFFQISEMILPASAYWTAVHGMNPGEILQDEEGMYILRTLADNVAWVLRLIQHGRDVVPTPAPRERAVTSFIR